MHRRAELAREAALIEHLQAQLPYFVQRWQQISFLLSPLSLLLSPVILWYVVRYVRVKAVTVKNEKITDGYFVLFLTFHFEL